MYLCDLVWLAYCRGGDADCSNCCSRCDSLYPVAPIVALYITYMHSREHTTLRIRMKGGFDRTPGPWRDHAQEM